MDFAIQKGGIYIKTQFKKNAQQLENLKSQTRKLHILSYKDRKQKCCYTRVVGLAPIFLD